MKHRPIIMSGASVRAILDGRKTQTRRPLCAERWWRNVDYVGGGSADGSDDEGDPVNWGFECGETGTWWLLGGARGRGEENLRCRYGEPGDRLWVKETWGSEDCGEDGAQISYRADRAAWWREAETRSIYWLDSEYRPPTGWRSPLYMPRWASRLTLDIVAVRPERVQAISEADAKAEGLRCWTKDGELYKWGWAERHYSGELDPVGAWSDLARSHTEASGRLWDQHNAKRAPWSSNPWVWVVEFRPVEVTS